MLGAAPLNSPIFTGAPTLPTGTQAVTQPGGTSNTSVATTAFVAASSALALPLTGGTMTGAIVLAGNAAANLNPVPLQQLTTSLGSYLLLTGGTLGGPGNLTVRGGVLVGAAGAVPAAGALVLNANAAAPQPAPGENLLVTALDANSASVISDSYGTGIASIFAGRLARGTAASPTAIQSGDIIAAFQGQGRAPGGYNISGSVNVVASENWTASAQGAAISFRANASGTIGFPPQIALFDGALGCQLQGTKTNDNAVAGWMGEYIASTITGPGISLTNSVAANVTSISLTAGDWDVEGCIAITPSATASSGQGWVNAASATPPANGINGNIYTGVSFGVLWIANVGTRRFSFAATTTVYLSTVAVFASGTCTAYGEIRARRVR
jgi:hypothetical protein